jgi:hypothetical protein
VVSYLYVFQFKFCIHFSFSSVCYVSRPFYFSWFNHQNKIDRNYVKPFVLRSPFSLAKCYPKHAVLNISQSVIFPYAEYLTQMEQQIQLQFCMFQLGFITRNRWTAGCLFEAVTSLSFSCCGVVKWSTVMPHIREVPSSNLYRISAILIEDFCSFSQSLQ